MLCRKASTAGVLETRSAGSSAAPRVATRPTRKAVAMVPGTSRISAVYPTLEFGGGGIEMPIRGRGHEGYWTDASVLAELERLIGLGESDVPRSPGDYTRQGSVVAECRQEVGERTAT